MESEQHPARDGAGKATLSWKMMPRTVRGASTSVAAKIGNKETGLLLNDKRAAQWGQRR